MLKGSKTTEAKSLAVGILQTCLTVLKDVATDVGIPGLGSAVGGLSTIVDMIQATSANTERVKSLADYVKNLTTVVANPLYQCRTDVSSAMNDRIDRLISAFILAARDMQAVKQRPLFKCFLRSKDGTVHLVAEVTLSGMKTMGFSHERLRPYRQMVTSTRAQATILPGAASTLHDSSRIFGPVLLVLPHMMLCRIDLYVYMQMESRCNDEDWFGDFDNTWFDWIDSVDVGETYRTGGSWGLRWGYSLRPCI